MLSNTSLDQAMEQRREVLMERRRGLAEEIRTIDQEIMAIDAYYRVRHGEKPQVSRVGRRCGRRKQVLELLNAADGKPLTRQDFIQKLDLKGDRPGEQSVSNALSALRRAGRVEHRNGRYTLVAIAA